MSQNDESLPDAGAAWEEWKKRTAQSIESQAKKWAEGAGEDFHRYAEELANRAMVAMRANSKVSLRALENVSRALAHKHGLRTSWRTRRTFHAVIQSVLETALDFVAARFFPFPLPPENQ